MIDFVCEILPGVFSACLAEYLMERKLGFHWFLGLTALNVVLVNLICAALFYIVLKVEVYGGFSANTAMKYMVVALAAGFALSAVEGYISKRFKLIWKDTKAEK